jgi:predicted dehydrogenase
MKRIRTAVIGVGYLGQFHAEKYGQLSNAELVAVADTSRERAEEIATRLGTKACADYRELIGQVDAVSIVTPTRYHYEAASFFLEQGIHVLLEKPITTTLEEADDLIRIAAKQRAVLQIGHLERFNPAFTALSGVINKPGFIEAVRVAPFKPRGTDVSVVLDLMIHDIELIQHIVGAGVKRIDSVGAPVFTGKADIANARILFENGCVANVTASRISKGTERRMKIFQHDAYINVDFQEKKVAISRKGHGEMFPGIPNVEVEEKGFEQGDALKSEIEAFLEAITTGKPPLVTGEDGRRALETALLINKQLEGLGGSGQ